MIAAHSSRAPPSINPLRPLLPCTARHGNYQLPHAGGTSSALFAVGAYVSKRLAGGGHSVLAAPEEGLQYNWSSRWGGPVAWGRGGGGGVCARM